MGDLIEGLLSGNKRACAKLISMVENEVDGYEEILKKIYKYTGRAYTIGITGPPGAGKSTITDKLVKLLRKEDKKIGIIAIDPTSPFTQGALLGDRIRMTDLSTDKNVFIRSMGTRGNLGGLSSSTQAVIRILDAYGCDFIIVETVGVGQSEIDIVKTSDTTLMVMVPGLGDDIQAIKAGVMEIADVFVVNKSDKDGAKRTLLEIEMMLDYKKDWEFKPPIRLATGLTGVGIEDTYKDILKHREFLETTKKLSQKRIYRNKVEIQDLLQKKVTKIINNLDFYNEIDELLLKTFSKELDPYSASCILFEKIMHKDI